LACLLWSAGWLFLKIGLGDVPPLSFAWLRLALAFVVLAAIVTCAASAAVLGGAACAAIAYAIVKRRAAHLPPAVTVATQTLCALIPLAVVALLIDGNPLTMRWTRRAVMSLLYLAIASSVVAFWLNYWLLKRVSATSVLSMALVQPLIAALLGALILGERFGMSAAIGGAAILISAAMILRRHP
jgi:drug/metabolite transporter (DMT)-like permease